jgi:hypothetical protein
MFVSFLSKPFDIRGYRGGEYNDHRLCDVAPYSLITKILSHRRVLPQSNMELEATGLSETLINVYEVAWHYVPEESNAVPERVHTLKKHSSLLNLYCSLHNIGLT